MYAVAGNAYAAAWLLLGTIFVRCRRKKRVDNVRTPKLLGQNHRVCIQFQTHRQRLSKRPRKRGNDWMLNPAEEVTYFPSMP